VRETPRLLPGIAEALVSEEHGGKPLSVGLRVEGDFEQCGVVQVDWHTLGEGAPRLACWGEVHTHDEAIAIQSDVEFEVDRVHRCLR